MILAEIQIFIDVKKFVLKGYSRQKITALNYSLGINYKVRHYILIFLNRP
jgi:hypothetical protein